MSIPLQPLSQISSYQVQELIAQGTFSRVYGAIDLSDMRQPRRALLELISQGDANELKIRQRMFSRMAEILEKLNHPAIPKFYRIFQEDRRFFVVQELIEGLTYASFLNKHHISLTLAELERVFYETLIGLAELHSLGIVHRDIKPANLMRRDLDQSTVIIDFGSSCELEPTHKTASNTNYAATTMIGQTRVYTPGYAHPDQRDDLTSATPQWDLYALAKTIIALCMGSNPPWPHPWSINQLGLSNKMQVILKEMLKSEGCSFQNASDVLDAWFALNQSPERRRATAPVSSSPKNVYRGNAVSKKWNFTVFGISAAVIGVLASLVIVIQNVRPRTQEPVLSTDVRNLETQAEVVSKLDQKVSTCVEGRSDQSRVEQGFAVRFYYFENPKIGASVLTVYQNNRVIAQSTDEKSPGFILIESMSEDIDFPPGDYRLELSVPNNSTNIRDVTTEEITLENINPFYYWGQDNAIDISCSI